MPSLSPRRMSRLLVACLVVFVAGAAVAFLGVRSEATIVTDRGTSTCGVLGGGTTTDPDGLVLDQRDPACADATRNGRLALDVGIAAMCGAFLVAGLAALWHLRTVSSESQENLVPPPDELRRGPFRTSSSGPGQPADRRR